MLLYFVLWHLARNLVHPAETEKTSYENMCDHLWSEGKVWSYFNTNPIFCLRSKYLDVHEPGARTYPCIPYVPGKQWLQSGVPLRFARGDPSILQSMKAGILSTTSHTKLRVR